jgi:hypothetical protein
MVVFGATLSVSHFYIILTTIALTSNNGSLSLMIKSSITRSSSKRWFFSLRNEAVGGRRTIGLINLLNMDQAGGNLLRFSSYFKVFLLI